MERTNDDRYIFKIWQYDIKCGDIFMEYKVRADLHESNRISFNGLIDLDILVKRRYSFISNDISVKINHCEDDTLLTNKELIEFIGASIKDFANIIRQTNNGEKPKETYYLKYAKSYNDFFTENVERIANN